MCLRVFITVIIKTIFYITNNVLTFLLGAVPRIVKVAPGCAIMISSYEYGKRFFYNYNASKSTSVHSKN